MSHGISMGEEYGDAVKIVLAFWFVLIIFMLLACYGCVKLFKRKIN